MNSKTRWIILIGTIFPFVLASIAFFIAGLAFSHWGARDLQPAMQENWFAVLVVTVLTYIVGMFLTRLAASAYLRARKKRLDRDYAEEKRHYAEVKRLQKLAASMTPAEWETYKVQLEIQKKLEAIRQNQNAPRRSYGYGMFIEPFD